MVLVLCKNELEMNDFYIQLMWPLAQIMFYNFITYQMKGAFMYKVEISPSNSDISQYNNTELICSYIFVKKTFNQLYKKKLLHLSKKEKKAIIYDLSLFETIKQKKYLLRSVTPQKWLENWNVFNGIANEIKKRDLSINNLDYI